MVDIIAYQGDAGYNLVFTVTDSNGNPSNLTGFTVLMKTWNPLNKIPLINNGVTALLDPPNGLVQYSIQPNDFSQTGTFIGVLILTIPGTSYNETTSLFTGVILATTPAGFGISRQSAVVVHVP